MVAIALYQPDIPQNVGAAIRLAACLGTELHIIEPCGFPWDERKIKQAGMDYIELATLLRHSSWDGFLKNISGRRIILLTTKTTNSYYNFQFQDSDILLLGRESAGVPENVHNSVTARITIPMSGMARSLNVINAASMVLGEMIRQLNKA